MMFPEFGQESQNVLALQLYLFWLVLCLWVYVKSESKKSMATLQALSPGFPYRYYSPSPAMLGKSCVLVVIAGSGAFINSKFAMLREDRWYECCDVLWTDTPG
jgi:hypothetical protein